MRVKPEHEVGQEVICVAAEERPTGRTPRLMYQLPIDKITTIGDGVSYHLGDPPGELCLCDGKIIYPPYDEERKTVAEIYRKSMPTQDTSVPKTVEIFLADLTEEKQREVLNVLGNDGNYDTFPIAVIETEPNQ